MSRRLSTSNSVLVSGRSPLAAVALAAVALLGGAGCRRRAREVETTVVAAGGSGSEFVQSQATPRPTTLVLTGAPAPTALREALARALQARGYVVEREEGQRLVARWSPRRVTLTIAIDYSPQQVTISFLEATGVEIAADGSSRRYDGWMRQLTQTIQEEIARPERERQEAVARAEQQQADRVREQRESEERARERDRQERLERERLQTQRAQAEAQAQASRARAAEAQARPRVDVGVHAMVGGLRFDAGQARALSSAVTVTRGFRTDPYVMEGTAGGPVASAQMGFPRQCPGFFPTEPQHTLVLPADMPYLRIEAPSEGDSTLAIVTPDGNVWCDDDSAGNLTPRLEGMFPAGVYRVFVGHFQRGAYAPYALLLSERGAQAGYVAGWGSYRAPVVEPVRPAAPPPPPDCRRTLIEVGQPSTSLMFCDGVEPYCADALLRAGHSATNLMFCRNVDPQCAVPLLQSGRNPTELQFCR